MQYCTIDRLDRQGRINCISREYFLLLDKINLDRKEGRQRLMSKHRYAGMEKIWKISTIVEEA